MAKATVTPAVTTQVVKKATTRTQGLVAVSLNGREIGYYMFFKDSKTDKNPAKAFAGKGFTSRALGHHWGANRFAEAVAEIVAAAQ
jgi:hypothetical protein